MGDTTDKQRILVVDDNVNWLNTIKNILDSDYDLTLCDEPVDAIGQLRSQRYALVILDFRMPGMSGNVLLRQMLQIRPDLRAIMVTAFPDLGTAVESMKTGALDYIVKGSKNLAAELKEKIKEALSIEDHKTIPELIAKGESELLEFKSTSRWDLRANRGNKELEKIIVKTVAAFLNSEKGGTLLIGVDDSGKIIGLEQDYQTLSRKDRDGYESFLTGILLDSYGKDSNSFLTITFHQIEGHDVCRISVRPSPNPVYVADDKGEHMFIRTGNSSRALSTREAIAYLKTRWKSL